ncbi:MAG: hypothetical protein FD167_3332, partial [bacterium]
QNMLSDLRKNYVSSEGAIKPALVPLPDIASQKASPAMPISQEVSIEAPTTDYIYQITPEPTSDPISEPTSDSIPIVTLPVPQNSLAKDDTNSSYNNYNNYNNFTPIVQPIRATDTSQKQVKILIIAVGILFGLLIITVALFIMQK